MGDWAFDDPPNASALATRQVMEHGEDVLLVTHEAEDHSWVVIGGPWVDSDLVVVCLSHAIDRDPSLAELADLPLGWGAQRATRTAPWMRFELPPEEE